MKSKLTIFILLFTSFAVSCFAGFEIERSGLDKYTGIEKIRTQNNWVKSEQGYYLAFDIVIGKDSNGEKDHFLILKTNAGFSLLARPSFSIGDHIFITIDESERIKLSPSILGSRGKFLILSNATFEHSVYIDEETYNKILNASYVYFEIQNSPRRHSSIKELTGYLQPANILYLRKLRTYE